MSEFVFANAIPNSCILDQFELSKSEYKRSTFLASRKLKSRVSAL